MSKELKVRLSECMQEKINAAIIKHSPSKDILSLYNGINISDAIPLPDAIKLLRWIQQNTNEICSNELVKNLNLILPCNAITKRSQELEKRIQLLKRKQEETEYHKMVENISRK